MLPPNNFELQSHWARYLCVLVSGFLEKSIHVILTEIAQQQSAPNIANYVGNKVRDLQNPKMEKILELLGYFNSDWSQRVRQATDGEIREAVDSIVNNRNQIAHGESVGISFLRVSEYYNKVITAIDIIEREYR